MPAYPLWADETVRDGSVVIASDAHYRPKDKPTLAHRALLEVLREVKPALVIVNGDILDCASIGRHGPLGWGPRHRVADELGEAVTRLEEVERAAPRARRRRTIGNHDMRFDARLARVAPEYEGLTGTMLSDHLPRWPDSWGVRINRRVIVKHRFRGGIHAAWDNVLHGGVSIVTGHTHQLTVREQGDYTGRRYGVECGMLADPAADTFEYGEGNPSRWCPGFVVLTFRKGELLRPEVCEVTRGRATFRGEVVLTKRGKA